jgi:GNAT superfamily N-acetyltransferase
MPTDYRDPTALWSIYGAHAAVMLRCGPAVMVAPAPGRVFVLSGADHVDLNQVALYRPAGRELATETVSLAFDAGVPVLLAVSSTVSEDVSDVLATGGFLRTSKREALFWCPHLPPEAASPFVIERVATGRTYAAARFVFASVHGYSAAIVDTAYGPRLLAHNDVDAWVAWEGNTPVGAVYITTVDGTLGVFEMMTVPAYRRRGVGRALLTGALAAAAARSEQPIRETCFWSTPDGQPLYTAVGFTAVDILEVWTLGASEEDLAAVGAN